MTSEGATAAWNPTMGANSFSYSVFNEGEGPNGTALTSGTTGDTNVVLTGLPSVSDLEMWVSSDCGSGVVGETNGPFSFTTLCGQEIETYNESFSSYIPQCWNEQKGQIDTNTTFTSTSSSLWTVDGFANNGSSGAARINVAFTSRRDWLITPSLNLDSIPNSEISFFAALTDAGNSNAPDNGNFGDDDKVKVVISTDNGLTWSDTNTLLTFDTANVPSHLGDFYTVDLSSYSGLVKIGFYAESTVTNESNDFSIDNFAWSTAVSCLPITGVSIDSISSNDVYVSVNNANTSTDLIVEYGEDGFEIGTGTQVAVTSPSFMISGLNPVTEYEFVVRAVCSASDSSIWSVSSSFETECAINETEYVENFDSFIPGCWYESKGQISDSTVFTSTTSSLWTADGFGNVGSTGAAKINLWSTNKFEWLISPTFNLDSIANSEISYFIALNQFASTNQGSFANQDKFHVVISTDNGITWSDDNILVTYDTANVPSNTGTYQIISLASYSGLVKIGFYGEKAISGGDIDISIDDFKWGEESNCVPVTNTSIDSVFSNDAYVSWTNDNVVNDFILEYGEDGFTLGSGTVVSLTDTFYHFAGLDAVTEYDFYIRSVCSAGDSSLWTSANSFTTECENIVDMYTQDFATYLPQCWEEAEGVISDSTVFLSTTNSDWTNDGYLNVGFTGAAKMNIWSNSKRDWLISPTLDLDSIPNSQISFFAALTDFGSGNAPDNGNFGEDDKVHIVISTDNGTTWSDDNILMTFDTSNVPSHTGGYYSASLASYSGQVKIGFYAESLVSNEDNDFFIDNFAWEETPSCLPVIAMNLDSIFQSDAYITTTNTNLTINQIIEYGETGFTLGTGTQITSTTTNFQISGLTPVTEYDVYVYNVCSAGDTSQVIVPFTFTTECPIYTTTYSQDFASFVPQCWEEFEGDIADTTITSGTTSGWSADGFLNNGTTGAARVRISGTTVNEWLITPSLNLSALPGSHIEFIAGLTDDFSTNAPSNGMGSDDTIQVVISTDNGITWSNTNALLTFDNNNFPSSNGQYYSISLAAYTGIVKIGFYAQSTVSNEGNDFFIDDFKWEVAPTCAQVSLVEVDTALGTSVELSWANPGSSQFVVEYGTPGFTLGTGTTLTTTLDGIEITGLDPVTTYEVYVRSVCAPGDSSDWSLNTYVITDCLVNTEYFVEDFASYVPLCWNEAAGELGASSTTFSNATSSSWNVDGFLNSGTSGAARINVWGTGVDEWLISESLDLDAKPNSQIEFDAGLTDYNNSNAPDDGIFGVDDKVVVVISTDNGATWAETNALLTFDQSNTPTHTGNHYVIPLTMYSGVVKIGFYAESLVSNEDNDFFIDNFEWSEAETCSPTDDMTVQTVGSNEATISWNNVNGVLDYLVEYGEAGFAPGTGLVATATDTITTLINLDPNTNYQAYVKAICSTTDSADYNSSVWFTTECEIMTLNSIEEFGTYLPECWTEGKGIISDSTVFTSTSSSWTGDGYLNNGTTGAARLNIFGTNVREWLISPSIDLTGGPRQIEFDAGITDFTGSGPDAFGSDDTLKVVISLDNGITWSNANVLETFDDTDTLFNAGNHYVIPVHMYSGMVKIGFYGVSTVGNTDYNVYIDNFEVKERDITSNDLLVHNVVVSPQVCIGESNLVFAFLNNIGLNPVDSFNLDVVISGPTAFDNNNAIYHQILLLNSLSPIEILNTSTFDAGSYSGTAIVSNPYDTIQTNDTMTFNFEIVDNPVVNAGSDVTICLGDAYTLNATAPGAVTFAWDGGLVNGSSVSPTTDTEYYVTGTNAAGCTSTDTVKVNVVNSISVTVVEFGGNLASSGVFDNYEWTLNGVVVGTTNQITPTENGTYTLTVTSSTGCQATDDYELTGIGLDEIDAVNVSVYPNPTTDILNIEGKDEIHSISIMDVQGKEVMVLKELTSKSINVSGLSQGYYILKGTINGTQFQTKFNKL